MVRFILISIVLCCYMLSLATILEAQRQNLFLLTDLVEFVGSLKADKSEMGMDPADHAKKFGYPGEKHRVTTPDGYNLMIHRIPHGRYDTPGRRPVVFIQVGILCSASCFIDVGPKRALGFLLADRGFDVWLGNFRGTTFSRNHTIYDPSKEPKFWQYSWHEMGIYDVPTMIDYVLDFTKEARLSYIGHSQGTTAFFVMTAEKPEYNQKINFMFALAPVAFAEHLTHPVLSPFIKSVDNVAKTFRLMGVNEVLPYTKILQSLAVLCSDKNPLQSLCGQIWDILIGYNIKQFNLNDMLTIMGHLPGGASFQQLYHFAQLVNSGKFRQFDFGTKANRKIYGRATPPDYNVTQITAPIYLMYGPHDNLATGKDVINLHHKLSNSVLYRVPDKSFNHVDFLWAKDIIPLVYGKIFDVLKSTRYVETPNGLAIH